LRRRVLLAVAATVLSAGVSAATVPVGPAAAGVETTPVPTPSTTPTPGVGEPSAEATVDVPRDPLEVVIERLTPSTLRSRGEVRLSGTVTNRSAEPWSELSIYLLTSVEPMTTQEELRTAVASDPRTTIGDRIVEPGTFTEAPDLAPGEKARFRLQVPVEALNVSGEPGVYWVGVHVLGTSPIGRLDGADGRARTFMPLVPERNEGTELALGVQFRNHTVRASDGTLEYLDGWQATFADGGRLRRLLELSATAPTGSVPAWVVDPAVLDAAASVSRDNPPLELLPPDEEGGEQGEEQETESPQVAAASWLDAFVEDAAGRPVLALPYGDLDVASVVRHGMSDLLTTALGSSSRVLEDRDVTSTPVLLPPSGLMSPEAVAELDPELPLVLAHSSVVDSARQSLLNRADGGRILLAPIAEDMFGPAPGAPRAALAVRQRLLAEAALHALSPARDEPLVRFLPPGWDPGDHWERANFFRGLDVPWLAAEDVDDVLSALSTAPVIDPLDDLAYPEDELAAELPLPTVLSTESLIAEGALVEELVSDDSNVDEQVVRLALLTSSVWSRLRPGLAGERAVAARDRVSGWLEEVTVRGPAFVTMSSESGTFQVTVVNGLDQRVTVALRATAPGTDLQLSTPGPMELPPNGRGAVRIDATSSDIGVHLVTLQPVSAEGTPIGEPTQVSIRSSRVGFILWIVMAVGGAALFMAIALRILRRVRLRRRTHGPVLKQAGP
jgi:hypothetical protein